MLLFTCAFYWMPFYAEAKIDNSRVKRRPSRPSQPMSQKINAQQKPSQKPLDRSAFAPRAPKIIQNTILADLNHRLNRISAPDIKTNVEILEKFKATQAFYGNNQNSLRNPSHLKLLDEETLVMRQLKRSIISRDTKKASELMSRLSDIESQLWTNSKKGRSAYSN